jgi:hypothetical protein
VYSFRCRDAVKRIAVPVAVFTAIICLYAGAALAQRPSQASEYTALMQQICRQYATATAQTGMPARSIFTQCMSERHCWIPPGSAGYQCELPQPMSWHGGGY